MSSGFFYKTAEEKEKLVKAERKFIEDRVQKIIDLKDKVCAQLWCSKLASQTTLHSILSVRWQGLSVQTLVSLNTCTTGESTRHLCGRQIYELSTGRKVYLPCCLAHHSFTHTELFIESLLFARNYIEHCSQSLTRVHGNKRL